MKNPVPVCLIYRNNDLFQTYVEPLFQDFDVRARHVIPTGERFSDHEVCITETVARAAAEGASALIVDYACDGADKGRTINRRVCLDSLFVAQIMGANLSNTAEENFALHARLVVEQRPVTDVVVVASCIDAHPMVGTNASRPSIPWVVAQLQSLFPGVSVNVVDTLSDALRHANKSEVLLVLDMHCGLKHVMPNAGGWFHSGRNWSYKSMLFTLPLETCVQQLVSLQKIDAPFDMNKMQSEIRKRILGK